jgi:hypothetical protein
MYDLADEHELDLEALRVRLRRMSDRELLRFGKSTRYMCSPEANLGKEPRQTFRNSIAGSGKGMAAAPVHCARCYAQGVVNITEVEAALNDDEFSGSDGTSVNYIISGAALAAGDVREPELPR